MPPRHTILVVDDEPDVVKSVQDLLRLDYHVLGATRAAEGLDHLASHDVSVVMTDQRMPEMTGVEFLRRVRAEYPDVVRLLFTGYADIRAVVDAINEGNVYRYITKPWDPDELQGVIREAVERHELITERKRLIEELSARNEELRAKNAQLREANDLKSAFIQVASHELRTPMTILVGLSRLAMTYANAKGPLKDWLGRIVAATGRLQHLIDELVSMLSAGHFERPLQRQPEDLAALVQQAVDDVKPFIELRGQRLNVDAPPDLGTMNIDASKIRDSLNHLLLNAVKFTPDGGTIYVGASRGNDGDATIVVRDTGTGIDPASLPRIFEPFFTEFDVSRHKSGQFEFNRKGLGLGLSVVKAFVEMHGGHVDVESHLNRGSTFTITLPANQGNGQPPPA